MLELPRSEMIVFTCVILLYMAAAITGIFQLRGGDKKCRYFLLPLVSLAITLEAVVLILRAVTIKAIPLTGLFESMIVLTIVFGLIFLFFSTAIRYVWFSSMVVWIIFAMILIAAVVATPPYKAYAIAALPWAIAHGIAMTLSGALITFAMANAFLYLLSRHRLKKKKIMKVLGKVPNIERLKHWNLFGLKSCFVIMTFGLASGVGLAIVKSASLQMDFLDWLTDPKIVLMTSSWILLAVILILHYIISIKDKTTAYITMLVFFLILFAIAGVTLFCGTKHNFTHSTAGVVEARE